MDLHGPMKRDPRKPIALAGNPIRPRSRPSPCPCPSASAAHPLGYPRQCSPTCRAHVAACPKIDCESHCFSSFEVCFPHLFRSLLRFRSQCYHREVLNLCRTLTQAQPNRGKLSSCTPPRWWLWTSHRSNPTTGAPRFLRPSGWDLVFATLASPCLSSSTLRSTVNFSTLWRSWTIQVQSPWSLPPAFFGDRSKNSFLRYMIIVSTLRKLQFVDVSQQFVVSFALRPQDRSCKLQCCFRRPTHTVECPTACCLHHTMEHAAACCLRRSGCWTALTELSCGVNLFPDRLQHSPNWRHLHPHGSANDTARSSEKEGSAAEAHPEKKLSSSSPSLEHTHSRPQSFTQLLRDTPTTSLPLWQVPTRIKHFRLFSTKCLSTSSSFPTFLFHPTSTLPASPFLHTPHANVK